VGYALFSGDVVGSDWFEYEAVMEIHQCRHFSACIPESS